MEQVTQILFGLVIASLFVLHGGAIGSVSRATVAAAKILGIATIFGLVVWLVERDSLAEPSRAQLAFVGVLGSELLGLALERLTRAIKSRTR